VKIVAKTSETVIDGLANSALSDFYSLTSNVAIQVESCQSNRHFVRFCVLSGCVYCLVIQIKEKPLSFRCNLQVRKINAEPGFRITFLTKQEASRVSFFERHNSFFLVQTCWIMFYFKDKPKKLTIYKYEIGGLWCKKVPA